MKPKITFEYYDGSNKSRPPMSKALWALIQECVGATGATDCHAVHAGSVGDPRTHRAGTSHMQKNAAGEWRPDAIDLKKLYLKWGERELILVMGTDKPVTAQELRDRELVHEAWIMFGSGETAHRSSRKHHHIHLQTPKSEWGQG